MFANGSIQGQCANRQFGKWTHVSDVLLLRHLGGWFWRCHPQMHPFRFRQTRFSGSWKEAPNMKTAIIAFIICVASQWASDSASSKELHWRGPGFNEAGPNVAECWYQIPEASIHGYNWSTSPNKPFESSPLGPNDLLNLGSKFIEKPTDPGLQKP